MQKMDEQAIIIQLSSHGKILSSRVLGRKIFEEAEKHNFEVVFDFSWVDMVNSSFTDEVFWKIVEKGHNGFKIRNVGNDLIKRLIIIAIEGRRQKRLA